MHDSSLPPQYPREVFRHWLSEGPQPLGEVDPSEIGELLDLVFFASLGKEEGTPALVRVVYAKGGAEELRRVPDTDPANAHGDKLASAPAWSVLPLATKGLDVGELIKIAPALEGHHTALAVGRSGGRLFFDGIARRRRGSNGGRALIVAAVAPGAVTLSREGDELFRYEHGQLVRPAPDVFFDEGPVRRGLDLLAPALRAPPSVHSTTSVQRVIASIVSVMAGTGRGGLLALTPGAPAPEMREAAKYRIEDPGSLRRRLERCWVTSDSFLRLARSIDAEGAAAWGRDELDAAANLRDSARAQLDAAVEDLGQLTAVDNALVLAGNLELVGAGYPIPSGPVPVIHEAVEAEPRTPLAPYAIGAHGSRHRAAASFVAAQAGRIVCVASVDGPLKCLMNVEGQVLLWRIRPWERP